MPATARASFDEAAPTGMTKPVPLFHHYFAARNDRIGAAAHAKSFVHGVIHAHVMSPRRDCVLAMRIPDHDIRIAACGDLSFARIQAEHLRRRGR